MTIYTGKEQTTPLSQEKEKINSIKSGYVQWLYKANTLLPIGSTTPVLPAGVYNVEWDGDTNQPVPLSKNIDIDDLFILPTPTLNKIVSDIRSFWSNREKYLQYGSVYKRGILLYGIAGCGKSSVVMLLAKELISKYNGVVFMPQTEDQIIWTMRVIPRVKEIEPDKRIIVVLEDIDTFVGKEKSYSETQILNFLDGAGSCDGIVSIATTNYPEQLQERVVNRPSRFDRRYEIGKPNAETRRFYIEHKLQKTDLSNINIEELVDKTEGFTIDHLKEYLLSMFVLGYSDEEALAEVSEIAGTRILKNTKEEKLGYKTPIKSK